MGALSCLSYKLNAETAYEKSSDNANIVSELERLKRQLIDEHKKSYPDEQLCPLCGTDWQDHKSMVDAILKQELSRSLIQEVKGDPRT